MSETAFILLEAAIRTARALVIVAGLLVALDGLRVSRSLVENPPHRAKLNALAWAIVGICGAIVAGSRLYTGYGTGQSVITPPVGLSTLLLWAGLATALVLRATIRAERPSCIWVSATLFGVLGLAFALLDAHLR